VAARGVGAAGRPLTAAADPGELRFISFLVAPTWQ
jgi:hypothetical protein